MSAAEPPLAAELLSRAHSPESTAAIYRDRVLHRPLLLRPTSPDPSSLNARAKRQQLRLEKTSSRTPSSRPKKPKPLSAKQKRSLQVHRIPPSHRKFSIYEPLHKLWCAYMRDVLGASSRTSVDANSAGPALVTADYHGALLEVVRSRCVSRVGIRGIVVKDTKFTFEVVTREDELKVLPKEMTVFRFEVPLEEEAEEAEKTGEGEGQGEKARRKPWVFEIYGDRFMSRAPERANKKFKARMVVDV